MELAHLVSQAANHNLGGEGVVLVRLCEAELARAEGNDSASTWGEIATAWEELARPYPVAYARWRQAAALTVAGQHREAMDAASNAVAMADRLSALPLKSAVEELLVAAHLSATDAQDPRVSLTHREAEVLRLLVQGHTYRAIAQSLGIATKTVSVHVHNLLLKLGARSSVEAVAIATRTNLLDESNEVEQRRHLTEGEVC